MAQSKREKRRISGWLILDKPFDMTSTQAVGKVRWLFGAAKAGHAGTLDPLATGILPIALGEATKAVPNVQDGEKCYRFAITWGTSTTTDDAEGEVLETSDHRATREQLETILPQFTGDVVQVPPVYSAIKVSGERAYDLARAGEKVALSARTVEISSLELISHSDSETVLEAHCGKGTYVRALARDIAEHLGTRGHVGSLRRTAVGGFSEARAVTMDQLEAASREERDAMLETVSSALTDVPEVRLYGDQVTAVRHGNPVLLMGAGAPVMLEEAWASFAGEVVAIGAVEAGRFQPRRVFNL
ncbi:tRNA pseudouridine synthase B [Devosia pacifica]|uniref:tRNA pseudouridine synthase B n=1 Tax=Devosia pacifica TaxID=1335967 RepID=A0A918S2P2_9HYPH|nr:tRNA pseudouridine(55) synthase TruB [Devosia pacifica]GHA20974.1 tRNA pseudouridine synthase B [Devosia pacifica]